MDRRPTLSNSERRRLFDFHDRTCHLCGLTIDGKSQRWEIEHVISRGMIGKRADTDNNMRPAHAECHKPKTARDARDLAHAVRCSDRHLGVHRSSRPMPFGRDSDRKRKIGGQIVPRHQPSREVADA